MPTLSQKLRELTLYISRVSEDDEPFGKVKLCKLLFNIDFKAYALYGASVTGAEYRRMDQGPVPQAVFTLLDEEDEIVIVKRHYCGYQQLRPVARREAEVSVFSTKELVLIDAEIRRHWGRTASAMSEESHQFLGWKLVKNNEVIPYEAALLEDRPLTDTEKARAWDIDMTGIEEMLAA